MRTAGHIALVLIAACFAFAYDEDAEVSTGIPAEYRSGPHQRVNSSTKDAFEFDLVQRTCAMYVAVRSIALETPIAFDRDLADVPVRWNMCPGGKMVACTAPLTASGDTIATGIPWPY